MSNYTIVQIPVMILDMLLQEARLSEGEMCDTQESPAETKLEREKGRINE